MANTHTTLTSLFDDIADAIRETDGSTGTIVADTFPDRIDNLDSGGTLYQEVASISRDGTVEEQSSTGEYHHIFPATSINSEYRALTKNNAEIDLIIIEFNVSDKCNITLLVLISARHVLTISTVDGETSYSYNAITTNDGTTRITVQDYCSLPNKTINGNAYANIYVYYDGYLGNNALRYQSPLLNTGTIKTDPRTGYIADTNCGIPKLKIAALSRINV